MITWSPLKFFIYYTTSWTLVQLFQINALTDIGDTNDLRLFERQNRMSGGIPDLNSKLLRQLGWKFPFYSSGARIWNTRGAKTEMKPEIAKKNALKMILTKTKTVENQNWNQNLKRKYWF